jgi:hypothetical protein
MTAEARTLAQNKLNIWGNNFAEIGELSTIKALERDAIIRVTDDYENALTNGTPEDIADAELALDEQYKGSYTPAEASQLKEQVEDRAVKQINKDLVDNATEAAFSAWKATVSPENPTESQKVVAENSVKSRVTNRRAERKLQIEAEQEDARIQINESLYLTDTPDYQEIKESVKASPLDGKEKEAFFKDINTAAETALKVTPVISSDSSLIKMENAVARLASGQMSKTEYYAEYGKASSTLSDPHRAKYIGEANPAYNKAIAANKKLADDEARNRIVTRTDEDILKLLEKASDGDISSLFADTASMKHQTELLNYSGYQIDVFGELNKEEWATARPNDVLPVLRSMSNTWAAKEWGAVYEEFKDNKEVIKLTQPIIKAYNTASDNALGKGSKSAGANHWGDLSTERQAAIIEEMDNGSTLEEAISAVVGRF